jgi:hypothetical protein
MRNILVSAAIGLSLAFGLAGAAKADTSVGIYFGTPHYDYRVSDGYRFRSGFGWYDPRIEERRRFRDRLTCAEARRAVRNKGYRNVATVECRGATYTFQATRRGRDVVVYINARTGGVWRG